MGDSIAGAVTKYERPVTVMREAYCQDVALMMPGWNHRLVISARSLIYRGNRQTISSWCSILIRA
jgi:hypothetical protein